MGYPTDEAKARAKAAIIRDSKRRRVTDGEWILRAVVLALLGEAMLVYVLATGGASGVPWRVGVYGGGFVLCWEAWAIARSLKKRGVEDVW